MKIVVDANIIIAALAKESITRELLLYPLLKYYSPDFALLELEKHKDEVITKMHAGKASYAKTIRLILSNVSLVSKMSYTKEIAKAAKVIGSIDKDDIPYVALSLRLKAHGIWTYDSDFKKQNSVRALSTREIIEILQSGEGNGDS